MIKILNQVKDAVCGILIKDDIDYLFEEILIIVKDEIFDKIIQKVKIKNEESYKNLCDELDFFEEKIDEIFYKNLQLSTKAIKAKIQEIQKTKYKEFVNIN